MHVIGVVSSILTYAGIFGLLMFICSPAVIISSFVTLIPRLSLKAQKTYLEFILQQFSISQSSSGFSPFEEYGVLYHYATGFTSVLIYAIFLYLGGQFNKDAFDINNPNFSSAWDSIIAMGGTGFLLGTVVGAFFILPVSLIGFLTLPINLPITLWKLSEQCQDLKESQWWQCAITRAPYLDLYFISGLQLLP